MTNTKLIEKAVELVVDLFEYEGIMEATDAIRARAIEWYNKTEIVDAEMLAAATITGSYQFGTHWDDLLSWKEFYFPSSSIEERMRRIGDDLYIGEIEEAQLDELWR